MTRLRKNLYLNQWTLVKKLLGWIICAKRPLKWQEIQAVLSIDHDSQYFNFRERSVRSDVEQLCGSLVRVLPAERPEDNRIDLVHVTARRYCDSVICVKVCSNWINRHILNTSLIQKSLTELELTTLCLRYLLWEGLGTELEIEESIFSPANDQRRDRLNRLLLQENFILQDYAVSKWPHHVTTLLNIDPSNTARMDGGIEALDAISAVLVDFLDVYEDDLKGICPAPKDVIACQKFVGHELYDDILRLWTHIRTHNEKGLASRNKSCLTKLAKALNRNRQAMEDLLMNGTRQDNIDHNALAISRIYGTSIFKCSKLTCFYFYAGFSTKLDRDKHVKRHDRPFECTFPGCTMQDCGFMSNMDLEKHKKFFHPEAGDLAETFAINKKPMAEAKFPCTLCDKRFTRRSNLRAHQRAHAGDRPYACSDCGKAFTRANDCRRHEKGHATKR
jgi:hypothetical protein